MWDYSWTRVRLPSAPPEEEASNSSFTRMSLRLCIGWGTPDGVPFPFPLPWNAVFCVLRRFNPVGILVYPSGFFRALKRLWSGLRAFERLCASRIRSMQESNDCGKRYTWGLTTCLTTSKWVFGQLLKRNPFFYQGIFYVLTTWPDDQIKSDKLYLFTRIR